MSEHKNDSWTDCPEGSLVQIANLQRKSLKRAQWRSTLSVVAAGCLIVVAGYIGYSSLSSNQYKYVPKPIAEYYSCSDALLAMDGYFASSLEESDLDQLQNHLQRCKKCHDKYEIRADQLGLEFSLAIHGLSFKSIYLLANH